MEMQVRDNIINEAKRIEEDSLCSAKGHFCAGQLWQNVHLLIGIPASVLAALAGASALSQFANHSVIAAALAIVASALSAVNVFLNPNEKAARHHAVGSQYNSLRNASRIFCDVEMALIQKDEDMLHALKKLNEERDTLNQRSPQIPRWAFERARRGIAEGESGYIVDEKG